MPRTYKRYTEYKKHTRRKKAPWGCIPAALQAISGLAFPYICHVSGMFPLKAVLLAAAALALLSALSFVIQIKSRTQNIFGKLVSAIIAIACALASVFVLWSETQISKISSHAQKAQGSQAIHVTLPGKGADAIPPFLVLVTGEDSWDDPEQEPGRVSGGEARSDVNLLVAVDPTEKKLLLVSTPRDAYVEIPGTTDRYLEGTRDKLTHAGTYGTDAVKAAHEWLYGTKPDYVAKANFSSFVAAIDAIGGIDVEVGEGFTMDNGFSLTEGTHHLNGGDALGFARERKSFKDGDFQRVKNQQAVIRAIVRKLSTPAAALKLPGILSDVLGSGVTTDMPESLMKKLLKLQMASPGEWDIQSMQLSCTDSRSTECFSMPGTSLYVAIPDEGSRGEIQEALKEFLEAGG